MKYEFRWRHKNGRGLFTWQYETPEHFPLKDQKKFDTCQDAVKHFCATLHHRHHVYNSNGGELSDGEAAFAAIKQLDMTERANQQALDVAADVPAVSPSDIMEMATTRMPTTTISESKRTMSVMCCRLIVAEIRSSRPSKTDVRSGGLA
jgi:hypothetical protein